MEANQFVSFYATKFKETKFDKKVLYSKKSRLSVVLKMFSVEDEEKGRHHHSLDNHRVNILVEAHPRTTVMYGIAICQNRLTNLCQTNQTQFQKNRRYKFCFLLLIGNKNDQFLNGIIACNEK